MSTLRTFAAAAAFFVTLPFAVAGQLADVTKGKLVRLSGDKVVPAEADALANKSIIAVYYSAHWCPPCRAFTPELVKFYNENKEKYPQLELVFVSGDKSDTAMKEYLEWGKMPWLAVAYKQRQLPALQSHSARGIPYLVVLDADGKELIGKPAGEDWRPPNEVLRELSKLLKKST